VKIVCSNCQTTLEPMTLLEKLVNSGGLGVTCSCGRHLDGVRVRNILSQLMQEQRMSDGRAQVRANLDKGIICPCCNQFAKRYVRKMSSIIARWLIAFARASGGDPARWVHVREPGKLLGGASSAARSGDYAKARYWGLLEEKSDEPSAGEKGSSGMWRLTPKGWSFVADRISVPERVLVFNNVPLEFQGADITIQTALGTNFNYKDLMGPAYTPPTVLFGVGVP
jgi:hypothetical protein